MSQAGPLLCPLRSFTGEPPGRRENPWAPPEVTIKYCSEERNVFTKKSRCNIHLKGKAFILRLVSVCTQEKEPENISFRLNPKNHSHAALHQLSAGGLLSLALGIPCGFRGLARCRDGATISRGLQTMGTVWQLQDRPLRPSFVHPRATPPVLWESHSKVAGDQTG